MDSGSFVLPQGGVSGCDCIILDQEWGWPNWPNLRWRKQGPVVLVMRSCCGSEGAPCTVRSWGGPSVKVISLPPAVHWQGSKNWPSLKVGKGKIIDSLGLSVWPLRGKVGNNDPQKTFFVDGGWTIGIFFFFKKWRLKNQVVILDINYVVFFLHESVWNVKFMV